MDHPLFKKIPRRVIAALLCAVMLVPFFGVPAAKAAPVPDGVTGKVTIYRFTKIADPYRYLRNEDSEGGLFMTWTDGGQQYYFRYPTGDKIKNHWEGDNYNGNLVLTDNLISTQPVLKDVLDNKVTDFISETKMDCGLSFGVAPAPDVQFGIGEDAFDKQLCYDSDKGGLIKPGYDDYCPWWLIKAVDSNTFRFGGATVLHTDSKSVSMLRHNGNKIYASKSGSDSTANFSNLYVIKPVQISSLPSSYAITADQVLSVQDTIHIPKGVTLTVKNGGVLSVGGQLLNDGKIIVEKGGLVVLREGATIMPLTRNDAACGGFVSDGSVVVRRNAKLIGGGTTGIMFSSGGAVNFGLIASESFRAAQVGTIENRTGGRIISGKTLSSTKYYESVCATLDHKMPPASSTIGEGDFQTKLSVGSVLITEGAIINRGGTWKDFGSFGVAENPIIQVCTRPTENSSWRTDLVAFDNEVGYYQSEVIHVTFREYIDAIGYTDEVRQEYYSAGGSAAGFEEYLKQHCADNGLDMSKIYNVYNGVFTVNGKTSLTVPWYEQLTVYKNDEVVQAAAYPWQVKAIWGDGARPAGLDDFADAPLLNRTFFIEAVSAPGKWIEAEGGAVADNTNVRLWPAQSSDHMRWTFRKGEVLYRNGEKIYYYNIVNLNSGRVMNITSATYASSGQNVRLSAQKTAPLQQLFRAERNSDGTYSIIPRGNDAFALELNGGRTHDGCNIQVGTLGGRAARWNLIETVEAPYVGRTFELEPACAPGMRLEIVNGSTYYGTDVGNAQIGNYNADAVHQRFRFEKAEIVYESGVMRYYYYIIPAHWRHQLRTYTTPTGNGTNVYQGNATGATACQWRIVENDDGTVYVVPRTNSAVYLGVAGGGTAAGTNVITSNATNNSVRWRMHVPGTGGSGAEGTTAAFHGKTFELESAAAPGLVAEVMDGSTSYGPTKGKVQLGTDAGGNYQRWRFEFAETATVNGDTQTYYYIVAEHSGHVLMPDNSYRPANGTAVIQAKRDMYPDCQKWRVVNNRDGTYTILTKLAQGSSELALSLSGGETSAGTGLVSANSDGSSIQKWKLNPVS